MKEFVVHWTDKSGARRMDKFKGEAGKAYWRRYIALLEGSFSHFTEVKKNGR